MREWNLKLGDPLSCVLAADARLGPVDYCNDQIWELSLGAGEPPALALQTTYGLRARSLRLFPRFLEGDLQQSDPSAFDHPPSIQYFYPNFLQLSFAPFPGIEVTAEYWIPSSQAAAGRFTLSNNGNAPRQIRVEWAALLLPSPDGQRMAAAEMENAPVLVGRSGGLAPVVFVTGGQAGSGPYPSLNLDIDLSPGSLRQVTWVHAALPTPEASFEMARQISARNWDAERARLELLNSGQVEIHTGDPDWDAAFSLSQKNAYNLLMGPTAHLPYPSFVLSRQPDQGFSLRGDGGDYSYLWNGQSPLEAYYLASLILPAAPHLVEGFLRNFLSTITEDGFIDWKPGLGGQRSQLLATPLLVSLADRIYGITGDLSFLREIFPALLSFVHAWFTPQQDRDGDGIPEWAHPMQAGFDDHPLFTHWYAWAQGVDIITTESPALCAFLYRECQTLIRIASLLGYQEPLPALMAMTDHLRSAVEISWDIPSATYRYWDRDSHYTPSHEFLAERTGPGEIALQREFEHPIRLLVRVHTHGESTRRPHLFAHGTSTSGQHLVERMLSDRFQWSIGVGNATSERVYQALERIEVLGLEERDVVTLYSVGLDVLDQTLLLPLWAGIPAMERTRFLVEKTITCPSRFWQPFGIPACIGQQLPREAGSCQNVHLPWNALLGEGLLAYGYRKEAAELVIRVMNAVIKTLKRDGAFHRYYEAGTGLGQGERNALEGLAPLGLFLETLGVKLISPQQVALQGTNPFPWPVTVKFRGLTVLRQLDKTIVIFPDGQTSTVTNPAPCVVALQ